MGVVAVAALLWITGTAYAASGPYGYEYLWTTSECAKAQAETVQGHSSGATQFYFTPELNLSSLKNPVMNRYSFGYESAYVPATVVAYGSKIQEISWPVEHCTPLPSLDGVRIGVSSRIAGTDVLTFGERVAHQQSIYAEDITRTVIKGREDGEGLHPATSDGVNFGEAELKFTSPTMTGFTQGIFALKLDYGFRFDEQLSTDAERGTFNCDAVTASGKVSPLYLGYDDMYGRDIYHYFLLPVNTTELRIRFMTRPEEDLIIGCEPRFGEENHSQVLSHIYEPGHGQDSDPGFDDSKLTDEAVIGGVTVKLASVFPLTFNKKMVQFSTAAVYDFDGDGRKESLSAACFDNYYSIYSPAIINLNPAGIAVRRSDMPASLGFAPGAYGRVFGYDDYHIFAADRDFSGTILYEPSSFASFATIDVDSDGRLDFLNTNDNTVVSFDAAGNPAVSNLKTLTMNQYLGIIPPNTDNPLGSGVSIIGGSKAPPAVFASYVQADINGDGYLDFVDSASGQYYMNLGDGRFVTDSFGYTIIFRDFDGDGISDFLYYDKSAKKLSVCLQRIGSAAVTRQLLTGIECGDDLWCRDFDKDGDVDILMPFTVGEDFCGLVMFENVGDGSFKKKEYDFDGNIGFAACVDWDADGKYEVLANLVRDTDNNIIKCPSYKLDGLKLIETPDYIYASAGDFDKYTKHWELTDVVDLDNSGLPTLVLLNNLLTPKTEPNTRPERPSAPILTVDEAAGEVTVTWPTGSDKETASADLTYELRIGSTPGADDIMGVAALADGTRRSLRAGNCGYERKRRFKTESWPKGKIYFSVQAVDDRGMGSEFSPEAVYSKNSTAVSFVIEAPEGVAVQEEVALKITTEVEPGARVEWSLDGGEIMSQNGSECRVRFTSAGDKTITLKVVGADGSTASKTLPFTVAPMRFEFISDLTGGTTLDLDLDGKLEILGDQFYEGNENGEYSKINRLFNKSYYYSTCVADINRDGLPDVLHSEGHLINEDDKMMSNERPDGFYACTYVRDLDNDGTLEGYWSIWGEDGIHRNLGDYVSFLPAGEAEDPVRGFSPNLRYYLDADGDGLIDYMDGKAWYRNLGGFRFERREFDIPEGYDVLTYNDYDGDGRLDILLQSDGSECNIEVLWADGTLTRLCSMAGYRKWPHSPIRFDFDNNGCNDLLLSAGNGDDYWEYYAYLFNTDRSFTKISLSERPYYEYDLTPVYRTDGSLSFGQYLLHSAPNAAPAAPTGVKATVDGDSVLIEWNAAADAETPAVAMRYNLSVKRKGAEGPGSYVISPLNGGRNGVHIPNDAQLISSTSIRIPLLGFSKGEYEVKVQAVDSQRLEGDFSEPVYVTVNTAGYSAPKEAMEYYAVTITFASDVDVTKVSFGEDAVVDRIEGQTAYVYWTSAGVKTVTAPELTFEVLVHEYLNAYFSLPEHIFRGDVVYITCDSGHNGKWKLSYGTPGNINYNFNNDWPVTVIDENTVALDITRFGYMVGEHTVIHTMTEPWGSTSYETTFYVGGTSVPTIEIVDIDDETGKYCVWMSGRDTDYHDGYHLHRETSVYNDFERIGYAGLSDVYIDHDSDPKTRTSRYTVKRSYSYGESVMSKPHQPIHAMISKGIGSEWNIYWNKYEGRDASTYRVLRGTAPQSLQTIAEVSGNTTSYTDFSAPEGTSYYAVETLIEKPEAKDTRAEKEYWRSRSNTVSTDDPSVVGDIFGEDGNEAVWYDLQGFPVENPAKGVYIRVIGGRAEKIVR